jgi:hypothetical protein
MSERNRKCIRHEINGREEWQWFSTCQNNMKATVDATRFQVVADLKSSRPVLQ